MRRRQRSRKRAARMLAHRDNWEALVADPRSFPAAAADEVLRLRPSIVAWRRKRANGCIDRRRAMPKGANILLLLGSANRDEAMFTDPQLFNIPQGCAQAPRLRLRNSYLRRPATRQDRVHHRTRGTSAADARLASETWPEIRVCAQQFVPGADRAACGMESRIETAYGVQRLLARRGGRRDDG